jgi:hypothetical protein
MWTKDVYQEQVLGYLSDVETEIEQLAHSRIQQHDLRELYIDLDMVAKRLWRLIGASDMDWEGLRYPLETSCDRLQRVLSLTGYRRSDVIRPLNSHYWGS